MRLVAVDTETHLITPGNLTPRMVCLSWFDGDAGAVVDRAGGVAFFRTLLADATTTIGGANIAFDLGVLINEEPDLRAPIIDALSAGRFVDTHILEALHDIGRGRLNPKGYSLAGLEWTYFRRDRTAEKGPDAWRMRYSELDGIPLGDWPAEAAAYPLADARGTWDVLKHQLEAKGRHNLGRSPEETRAAFALHMMSVRGMKTDPVMVQQVASEIRTDVTIGMAEYQTHGLIYSVNHPHLGTVTQHTDTAEVRALVKAAYGPRYPRTPTGRPSISRDTLENSGNPLLEGFAALGKNLKLLHAFVPVLERGAEAAVQPRYNILVASGRTSCRKPNLQQLPRKGPVRECFVPRPGFLFCSVDYGGVELCTRAQVELDWFGHSALADALNAGEDPHWSLAAQILGLGYEAAKLDPRGPAVRQMVKGVNYGVPGMMGAAKLVLTARKEDVRFCELSGLAPDCAREPRTTRAPFGDKTIPPTCITCLKVATALKKATFKRWKELRPYLEKCKALAKEGKLEQLGMLRKRGAGSGSVQRFLSAAGSGRSQARLVGDRTAAKAR